jgi:hypothetical protein
VLLNQLTENILVFFATDERGKYLRQVRAEPAFLLDEVVGSRKCAVDGGVGEFSSGSESISASWNRSDDVRTQQFAELADLDVEIVFLNDEVWPHDIEQLIFGHQLTRSFSECDQYVKSPLA